MIGAGSSVSYQYVLRPLVHGYANDVPSYLQYQTPEEKTIIVHSSTSGPFYIASQEDFIRYLGSHWVRPFEI
jgi:hypothetical protein